MKEADYNESDEKGSESKGSLTYEEVYELVRKEKYRQDLQELNKDIYEKATKYLKDRYELLNSLRKKKSIFASTELIKIQKSIENTTKLLKELYERRESKIINLALLASRTAYTSKLPLLAEEKEVYDEIVSILSRYKQKTLFSILEDKSLEDDISSSKDANIKLSVGAEIGAEIIKPKDIKSESLSVLETEDDTGYKSNMQKLSEQPIPTKLIRLLHAVPQFIAEDLCIYGPFEKEDIANIPAGAADVLLKKERAKEMFIKDRD